MLGFVSAARLFWQSRSARYQADALRHQAEARRQEKRAELLSKPYLSASEAMTLRVLEEPRSASLFEAAVSNGALRPVMPMDPWQVWRDYLNQLTDFSRGGWGWGGQATDKTGRLTGADYPFFWDETSLGLLRSTGRLCVGTNPNAAGLLGGMRRYVWGSGATVRVRPKAPQYADAARQAQAFLDEFRRVNRMAFREREGFTRAARDGEAVFILGHDSGPVPWVRFVWPEQIRQPHDRVGEDESSFGRLTDPDDAETTLAWFVHPLNGEDQECQEVKAEAIVYLSHNLDSGVKRGKPDFCHGVTDALDAADELGRAMGKGSTLQAKIAYIREHASAPADAIRALPPATATHQKMDAFGNVIDAQKFMDGTIIDTKDSKFVAGPYNAGIQAHLDVFQMLNRRAQSIYNAPEWLGTSYSQEVNFAASLTAESPLVMTGTELQAVHADCHRDLHERALAIGAAINRLPRNILEIVDVAVTLPSMVVRDKDKEAQTGKTQLDIGATSPQKLCEEAGNEWEQIQKDRKAVGLGPVGSQPPGMGPGAGPGSGPPDSPAPTALPAPDDAGAPFALDVAAESEAVAEAAELLEAGTFTGVIFGKYFVQGKHVDAATYRAATAAGQAAKGKPSKAHMDRAATEKAADYFRLSAAADKAGHPADASRYRVAGAAYHIAAGAYAKGNQEGGDLAVRHAEEYASGKRAVGGKAGVPATPPAPAGSVDRSNPDLDAAMAAPPKAEPKGEASPQRPNAALDAALGGTESPALTRGYSWAAKQADTHSAKVAEHLGLKSVAARSMLNRAIRQAVEKAVASGTGSIVITGKGGKKIRVTVRKKVSESEGTDGGFEAEFADESLTGPALAAHLLEAARYDEGKHPRDDRGRFVDKEDIEMARHDPEIAAEVRANVTNPAERAKLDAMIGAKDEVPTAAKPTEPEIAKPTGSANKALPDPTRPPLTAHEADAIDRYVGWDYGTLNTSLRRDGKPSPHDASVHESLQSAFAKAKPFDKPVQAHREMALSDDSLGSFIDGAKKAAEHGGDFPMGGYVSTSVKPTFVPSRVANVVMKINATKGLDLLPYTEAKYGTNESELLLNHGSRFRVKAVTQEGNRWTLELDQVA